MAWELCEGERLDDLVRDGMRIIQRPDQFCFSVDSVLLAHFVSVKRRDRFAELGTGTGAIALLLAAFGAAHVTAIEKNPVLADLAAKSVCGNGKEDVISVLCADYTKLSEEKSLGHFTAVVVNPPYRPCGAGRLRKEEAVAAATHETTASLSDVFDAAAHLLQDGGRLFMVHRADRLADLIYEGRKRRFEPKRLRFIQSHEGEEARRVLLEWRRGSAPDVKVLPPLVLHRADGSYTDEMLAIYGKEPT